MLVLLSCSATAISTRADGAAQIRGCPLIDSMMFAEAVKVLSQVRFAPGISGPSPPHDRDLDVKFDQVNVPGVKSTSSGPNPTTRSNTILPTTAGGFSYSPSPVPIGIILSGVSLIVALSYPAQDNLYTCSCTFHQFVGYFKIGIDILHVVVFERSIRLRIRLTSSGLLISPCFAAAWQLALSTAIFCLFRYSLTSSKSSDWSNDV